MSEEEPIILVESLFETAYKPNPHNRDHLIEAAMETSQFATMKYCKIGTHPIVCVFSIRNCITNIPLEILPIIAVITAAIGIPFASLDIPMMLNPITLYIETIVLSAILRNQTLLGLRWGIARYALVIHAAVIVHSHSNINVIIILVINAIYALLSIIFIIISVIYSFASDVWKLFVGFMRGLGSVME